MNEDEELSPELMEFINQLIVPLLVEQLMAQDGHLYSARDSQYDAVGTVVQAAQEAA